MPCGIRRRQTLNRPCVCVHCVYLTNTTIRKATTTVPQSGSHVVYFDLYPSPLVDPPPHMPSLPGLPFSVAASTKTRQTFHTHQTWGPTYGVVHNFVYLIFMSCAVAITRQAKPGQRERYREWEGGGCGCHYSSVAASSGVFPAPGIKLSCFSCLIASARLHWPQAAAHLVVAPACAS